MMSSLTAMHYSNVTCDNENSDLMEELEAGLVTKPKKKKVKLSSAALKKVKDYKASTSTDGNLASRKSVR